jgi:hypothetical protein
VSLRVDQRLVRPSRLLQKHRQPTIAVSAVNSLCEFCIHSTLELRRRQTHRYTGIACLAVLHLILIEGSHSTKGGAQRPGRDATRK